VGAAYRKPRSPVKSQSALRPCGWAIWQFRWETNQDGRGLTRHRGRYGVRNLQQRGLEVEVGERVSPKYLGLRSSPAWLLGQDKTGHWEKRIPLA